MLISIKVIYYIILGSLLELLGRTQEAIEFFDKATKLNPKFDDAYYCKGYNLIIEGVLLENVGRIDEVL